MEEKNSTVAIVSELALAAFQVWMMAAAQDGMTADQIEEHFQATYKKFLVASAVPVDPVKE